MMKNWKLYLAFILLITIACQQIDNTEIIQLKKDKAIHQLNKNDSITYTVEEAMALHDLKGLSVAVFENYQLSWTENWGVKDVVTSEKIDFNTAFSTASIAKPITATIFAILEEKGLIDLKAPVSSYLKRWKLPESEFLNTTDLTLEHILSHTAGTTQGGFADFYEGDTIPTIVQSLKGELPNYDKEIEIVTTPGSEWNYSGGGYVIAQMALEDHFNKSLADIANEYLFQPLGLKHTTMKQPNEIGFLKNVAKVHNEEGAKIKTGIPITPQVAPSGLWSTPTDMATFLIEMQNALRGENNKVISQNVAQRVTKLVTIKIMGGWSLGWERRHAYGNYDWFSHGGANTGTGGYIYATMEDGNGIAFFGNSANKNRIPVLDQFRESIVKAHNWYKPLDRSIEKPLAESLRNSFIGQYLGIAFGENKEVIFRNGKLFLSPYFGSDRELIYIGDNTFMLDEIANYMKFEINPADGKMHIALIRKGIDEKDYVYKKNDN